MACTHTTHTNYCCSQEKEMFQKIKKKSDFSGKIAFTGFRIRRSELSHYYGRILRISTRTRGRHDYRSCEGGNWGRDVL